MEKNQPIIMSGVLESKLTFEEFESSVLIDSDGNSDGKCVFCSEMCTKKSSCGNRFFGLQGTFTMEIDEEPEVVYTCDGCYDLLEIEEDDIFIFKDKRRFYIGNIFRVND
jgi:hypothetical protein